MCEALKLQTFYLFIFSGKEKKSQKSDLILKALKKMDPHGTGSNTGVRVHKKLLASDFLFLFQVGDVFSRAYRVINETKSSNYILPKREKHIV